MLGFLFPPDQSDDSSSESESVSLAREVKTKYTNQSDDSSSESESAWPNNVRMLESQTPFC